MPEQSFKIFFKGHSFKKSHLNTTEGGREGGGAVQWPQPSFSWKWGMGKLNQTDGYKRLLKWGIYIGATACKNLDPPQYPEG